MISNEETQLVEETLRTWADEARVPADLADRALRGRRRRLVWPVSLATAGAAIAVACAVAIATVGLPARHDPAPEANLVPLVRPNPDTGISADPAGSPPERLVAAGQVAMSAYYVVRQVEGEDYQRQEWYLYNPTTGRYARTPWASVDVAPGLRLAAVLESPLPVPRVALVDMATGGVVRRIRLEHTAGGLKWSPDGRRLLITTYRDNPANTEIPKPSTRTGFYLYDLQSGTARFRAFPPDRDNMNSQQDFGWSRDGSLIYAPTVTVPTKRFYRLDGRPAPAPKGEDKYYDFEAGHSPSGKLPPTEILDRVPGLEQLNVWADDSRLIALQCDPRPGRCEGKGEFHNRFVLVDLDKRYGARPTPLTGYRENSQEPGSWEPLFTRR